MVGIGPCWHTTLEEISRTFHLNRECIRQIELKVLTKLPQLGRHRCPEPLITASTTPKIRAFGVEISVDDGCERMIQE